MEPIVPPGTRMTMDAFLKLPDEKPTLELENGIVLAKPACGARHSILQSAILERIQREVEPRKLAMAFLELRVVFGGNAYVPDVSVIRWDRIQVDDEGWLTDEEVVEPPAVAVEIGAPEHDRDDQIRRCRWFVENGVGMALFVDEGDRSVHQFRSGEPTVVLRGDDLITDDALGSFSLSVNELYASLRLD
jgi:Uma2 family endonuclease